jgi:hypothetical protein
VPRLRPGYGFIAGFNVYDSFESQATAKSGLMPAPNQQTESLLGGHRTARRNHDADIARRCVADAGERRGLNGSMQH